MLVFDIGGKTRNEPLDFTAGYIRAGRTDRAPDCQLSLCPSISQAYELQRLSNDPSVCVSRTGSPGSREYNSTLIA